MGAKFTARTDHNCLRWLKGFREPEGQVARWLEILAEFDMDIQHRSGAKHGNADGLSRRPCSQCGMEAQSFRYTPYFIQPMTAQVEAEEHASSDFQTMNTIVEEQLKDDVCGPVIRLFKGELADSTGLSPLSRSGYRVIGSEIKLPV